MIHGLLNTYLLKGRNNLNAVIKIIDAFKQNKKDYIYRDLENAIFEKKNGAINQAFCFKKE